MKVELELWHLILLLIAVVGGFWAMAQMLMAAGSKNVADRFEAIQALIRTQGEVFTRQSDDRFENISALMHGQSRMLTSQSDDMRRIERDLMGLKAELPRDYVRREDYTQTIATIMTKIDHATLLMQQAVRDAYNQAFKAAGNPQHKDAS